MEKKYIVTDNTTGIKYSVTESEIEMVSNNTIPNNVAVPISEAAKMHRRNEPPVIVHRAPTPTQQDKELEKRAAEIRERYGKKGMIPDEFPKSVLDNLTNNVKNNNNNQVKKFSKALTDLSNY